MCVHIYVCICVCMCVNVCICVYIYVCIYIYVYLCVCVYICVYICTFLRCETRKNHHGEIRISFFFRELQPRRSYIVCIKLLFIWWTWLINCIRQICLRTVTKWWVFYFKHVWQICLNVCLFSSKFACVAWIPSNKFDRRNYL